MLSRWQKMNIVHGFLNSLDDDIRLSWHHTIEQTYDNLKDGHYGQVWREGNSFAVHLSNGIIYNWNE